ncbi:MAG: type IX secretion system membrane protein PorP/SprF [Prevotellaceae bacterium]|nr:type IX secretion system membrane protein PorP/SprF [Prevotellaceae bacterium]MBF1073177.1 type IX secretion system membrane protein PorP/SprF [Prevotellaceae bacterium]
MYIRRLIIVGLLLNFAGEIKAQYDPSFSHYFDMETSFNPASAGKQPKINVTAAYAMDMAGFEHNPQTAYAAADMPFYALRSYHGAGVLFMNDRLGLFTHMRLTAQYAYKFKLLGGQLSVGLQAGLISEKLDGSKADLADSGDPAFNSAQLSGNAVDLGAGIYYTLKDFYAGISVQHITSPLVKLGDNNELPIDKTYYLSGGYNIKLHNPFLTIKPSVLVKTDMVAWRADVTGRLVYSHDNKLLYGGLSYSPTNSVTMLVGGSFHGIVLGYSYEFYTSGLNPGNGSHELFVGYQQDINLVKKGKNKHKSVRIL